MFKNANILIANTLGLPLQDKISKTSISKSRNFLMESQFYNAEALQKYQEEKLRIIIEYAFKYIPFYSYAYKAAKLNITEINEISDIIKLPIISKEQFRKDNAAFFKKDFDVSKIRKGKSGGTTGAPVITLHDNNSRSIVWGSYYRWYDWMGIKLGDPVITLWGSRTVLDLKLRTAIKDKFVDFLYNNTTINAFQLNKNSLPEIINILNSKKPYLIKGYLSAIYQVAEYIKTHNIQLKFNPKAISTTSETLLPPYRLFIERIFGCPVYDQYGCGEVEAVAYECAEHNGLHVNSEHVIVEVLDENDQPVFDKIGRIVVTDLDNFAMPIIRYENGDLGTLSSEKCTCGRNHPLLKSIDGRTIETIILANGSKVHGVFFTDIFHELNILTNQVNRFQVFQEIPGDIELRLEVKDFSDRSYLSLLQNALNSYFNNAVVSFHEQLRPDSSGKFRYILNNTKSI